ncbi:sorbitol dehydrogenase family protein [Rhizobium gallicum]|uniref:sorbitol dehydrogenase family protein n=1 Tax=Rhizobium gallicum TaxID=56730 RepID=UPI001EF75E98|nr:sorbitol dehydrogenase family protein [Rhizobium gallicum]ULJ75815.1 sorbitol dehydrogenase family protein [Rhizobium gallicum]
MSGLMSRRLLLLNSGISVIGLSLLPALAGPVLAAASTSDTFSGFMSFSRLATGHINLDEAIGSQLYAALSAKDDGFIANFHELADMVESGGYTDVEALDAALTKNPLRDTLLRVIKAWYSGVVEDGTGATVYAFEKALMYQPARDVVVIPTFAFNGPDYWVAEPNPVAQMPQF